MLGGLFIYTQYMEVIGYKIQALRPPQDSLLAAIKNSRLSLREGDIVAISSKVVSIDEGACVPLATASKEMLVREEADWIYTPTASRWRKLFTIARGALVGSSGIDESNGSGHYVLYPKDPFRSAVRLRKQLMKEYGIRSLALIITDSTSIPLRRGAIGFALAWDGIDPLRDYRGTQDIFGRRIKTEVANLVDSLAASAVLEMGEGNEQTPIAVIRNARNILLKNRSRIKEQLIVALEDDIFAPLLWRKGWKGGGFTGAQD